MDRGVAPPPRIGIAATIRALRPHRLVAMLVAGAIVSSIGYAAFPGTAAGFRVSGGGPLTVPASRTAASIQLVQPGALALDPSGDLYIADTASNQIIERLPSGTFRIFAGTGKAGFSGDGQQAIHARLNRPGGMAIGPTGALYFADSLNGRIRVIAPNGTISTIAGNGKSGWVRNGTPAWTATMTEPSAVTISRDGRLYIADSADNEVLRLERTGTLTRIAGNHHFAGVYGVGHPALNASPDGPTGLAFDHAGNLYLTTFNVKTLLMITPKGTMTLPDGIGSFYPGGDGAVVSTPNGSVFGARRLEMVRITPHSVKPIIDFGGKSFDGITGFTPNGIAVAANGDIYADTWVGNGYTNKTALIVVRRTRTLQVLWKG